MTSTTEYAMGTSVTMSYPFAEYVTARVLCSDGKVRKVARISGTADTFFSVPAAVRVAGRTVSGFMTIETAGGFSTESTDDPFVVKFVRHSYGKNAALLPEGAYDRSE